jgi:hypothetical protein
LTCINVPDGGRAQTFFEGRIAFLLGGTSHHPCGVPSARSAGHRNAVINPIARMHNDLIAGRKSAGHFRKPIVAMADLHGGCVCSAVDNRENGPSVAPGG